MKINTMTYISLDGPVGVGCDTQYKLLREKYGKIWNFYNFPTSNNMTSFFINKYIQCEFNKYKNSISIIDYCKNIAMLYLMDKLNFFTKDKMYSYKKAIFNGFMSSDIIHLGAKLDTIDQMEEYLDWIYDYEFNVLDIPCPGKIIYLKAPGPVVYRDIVYKNMLNMFDTRLDESDYDNFEKLRLLLFDKYDMFTSVECYDNKNDCLFSDDIIQKAIEDKISSVWGIPLYV